MKSLLISSVLLGGMSLAQAQVSSNASYRMVSSCGDGTKVLAVQNSSMADQAPVVLESRNDSLKSQIFKLVSSGNGYQIIAEHSGKALDVYQALLSPGIPIRQHSLNGGSNQVFKMIKTSGGFYRAQNLNSGLYLSASNTSSIQDALKSNCSEKFKMVMISSSTPISGTGTPTAPTPSGLPDLVVSSLSISPTHPLAGQAVTYSAQITNRGTAATPAGKILGVLFNTDGGQSVWSDSYTQSLQPGASITLTANGGEAGSASVVLSSGSHTLRAQVNDLVRFPESDLTNNAKDFAFNVDSSTATPSPAPAPAPTPAPVPAPSPAPTSGPVSPYGQDASLYTLTFQDEFDGSSLNTSKWRDYTWYGNPSSTHNYEVSNGSLKIWPERNSSGQFEGRYLVTEGKYYQTYGYFEMEAKLPVGKGCWPAFWLLNSDEGPTTGAEPEIDIMEAYSGDVGYWANQNMESVLYEATIHQNGANQPDPGVEKSFQKGAPDLSTAFHKYAVKWEPGRISFYFDGKLFASQTVSMTKRMYILLDLELNGGAGGNADSSTPTGPSNSFEIKYVRAWQVK